MLKNPYIKNILSALAIAFGGFLLLNITFIFDFLIQSFFHLLVPTDFNTSNQWIPLIKHIVFALIILFISWLVLKSKAKELLKATFLVVPLAVIFVTIGMFLYRWPVVVYSVSAVIFGITLLYLYRTKKPWLYYYSASLIALVLLTMSLFGIDI